MTTITAGERWAQGKILVWLNQIIKKEKLPFEGAEQEVEIVLPKGRRRYPDIVVWHKKPDKIACIIELKQPTTDVYNDGLIQDALEKATWAGVPFFATWNVNKLVLWETFKPGTSLLDRRLQHWDIIDIKRITELEKHEETIRNFIKEFLTTLAKYYEEKIVKAEKLAIPIHKIQVIPKLYPDEILVYRLKAAVDALYIPISEHILKKKEEDPKFYGKVAEWFVKQGWIFSDSEEDYDRLARQAVYLLINKILFYNVLKSRFKLSPIDVSNVKTGKELKEKLQEYFNTGVRLGYGVIFAADFLETIPIPDEAVDELKRLIEELNKYDFSKIGYDVIGKVFEKLIPRTERHKLGQYFTRTDVVDLILGLTIKHPDARVLDPACGSGTFLVRAYYRKKYLARKLYEEGKYPKPDKPHEELIKELWGIDIAKFPAHLAEINLIIRNLEALENKPVIACRDFFEIEPGRKTPLYELAYKVPGLTKEQIEVAFPKDFDAVITNPPYTRQEEMEDMFMGGYKERLRQLVKRIHGIDVGKRSSIYVYFFFHGGSFVKEGGRVGLITSNSWLDVDYGKYLQEYFLKNFKIIAIIESKIERWFEDADIITAITILEKCDSKRERDENLVKFVQLKAPLRELIPELSVEDEEEKERLRWEAIDELVKLIEETNEYYEDDKIRIFPKKQAELWDEGYDDEKGRYVGSKWGKNIRAPQIFFKILKKGQEKGLFIPLRKVAMVRRGFTTGADGFFYLTEDEIRRWGIELEFWTHIDPKTGKRVPNYVITSPRESKTIVVNPSRLKYRVLLIHKSKEELKGTNVLKYILHGEEKGYHQRPTCKSRARWYDLGSREPAPILFPERYRRRWIVFFNPHRVLENKTLYGIIPFNEEHVIPLVAYLNSTIVAFLIEFFSRPSLGPVLDIDVWMVNKLPVINPDLVVRESAILSNLQMVFEKINTRVIGTVFEEILGKDISESELTTIDINELVRNVKLQKVRRDRLELDRIFFKLLGLDDKELEELYRQVIDLVASRIKREVLVRSKKKKKSEVNPNIIAENIIKRITFGKRFPEDYFAGYNGPWSEELKLPKGSNVVLGTDLGGFYVKIDEREVYRSWKSHMAKFIYYALLCGNNIVRIPRDEDVIKKAVEMFEEDLRRLKEEVSKLLELTIPDVKIRSEVENIVWRKILGKR